MKSELPIITSRVLGPRSWQEASTNTACTTSSQGIPAANALCPVVMIGTASLNRLSLELPSGQAYYIPGPSDGWDLYPYS